MVLLIQRAVLFGSSRAQARLVWFPALGASPGAAGRGRQRSDCVGTLGAVAIVYGAMAALAQRDLRLLMAYSSLSHVGFITLGMFALNEEGLAGATLQMFNHGLTTAAMFLLMACLVVRRGSTRWDEGSRGIANNYPRLAFFLVFFVVAGAGTPGLNNFVGEFLALVAMISVYSNADGHRRVGSRVGAWYALRMTQNVLFGKYDPGKRSEFPVNCNRAISVSIRRRCSHLWPCSRLRSVVVPLSAIDIFRGDVERIAQVSATAKRSLSEPLVEDEVPLALAAVADRSHPVHFSNQSLRPHQKLLVVNPRRSQTQLKPQNFIEQ